MSTWSLPGYEVEELLGSGATGEVWRATDTATGEVVALKRLRPDADPDAAAGLRREARLLGSIDTPYLVQLRAVVGDVLVLDYAAGGSLAALLSRRGCLEPGEVVTVAAPLASALSVAHAAGLVHGDVSPANILFTSDGMPLLTDLGGGLAVGERPDEVHGTAEYVDPAVVNGARPGPASDVWALGAVCHHLLAGTPPHDGESVEQVLAAAGTGGRAPLGLLAPAAPRALVAVIEAALSADPLARPAAAALARALQRAQAPAPVRLHGGPSVAAPVPEIRETHAVPRPPRPADDPPARRRLPLPVLAGVGLALVLLMGGLLWSRTGRPSAKALPASGVATGAATGVATGAGPTRAVAPPGAAAPARSAPPTPDWKAVLTALDTVRGQAFAGGGAALLTRVYVAGSAVDLADVAAVTTLIDAGQVARGVRHEVRRISQTSYSGDTARLRVVDVLGPQTVLGSGGAVVQTLPGRGESAYDVELVRQDGGWRIAALQSV